VSGLKYIVALPGAQTLEVLEDTSHTNDVSADLEQAPEMAEDENAEIEEVDIERLRKLDLRKWRKRALNDVRRGSSYLRSFQSDYIDDVIAEEIEDQLAAADGTAASIEKIFTPYLGEAGDLLIKIKQLGLSN
jgi:hypothetical protein